MMQLTPSPQPFWIIWNPEGLTPPRVKFADEANAEKAAKNLARLHPGQEFFVLQMIGVAKVPAVPEPSYIRAAKPGVDSVWKALQDVAERQKNVPLPTTPYSIDELWPVPPVYLHRPRYF